MCLYFIILYITLNLCLGLQPYESHSLDKGQKDFSILWSNFLGLLAFDILTGEATVTHEVVIWWSKGLYLTLIYARIVFKTTSNSV